MHWIDWSIVIGLLTFIIACAFYTNRYTKSVADFLAANRCAGRYLLCISSGIAGLGAISVVAMFEMYYNAGFTATWWGMIVAPVGLLMALSGWVSYRLRETRAMTLAQFFEVRYSKSFRVFAGIVLWVSGIVNFGIFPAVGARFFIYFCGLPQIVTIPSIAIPLIGVATPAIGISVFASIMLFLLAVSILFVFLGGQVAVMITDFFQGMFTNAVFLIILVAIFCLFDWSTIVATLREAPAEASLLHPFHTSKVEGFNFWYFFIQIVTVIYGFHAWQGSQAYNWSAKSAHEAKMAGILGEWRGLVLGLVVMMLPIGAYVVMHHADYTSVAEAVHQDLGRIESETIRKQMTVPLALAHVLPPGIVGLLCAVMVAAFISTHDTYLHSWGSIFVQDVILPFRKRPFTPTQHLWLLRFSILFVAIFIFCWSMFVPQKDYILMFFAITGAIWLGGAGSVIIGGLYWKRGSTVGAFMALSVGAVIAVTGIVLGQFWEARVYPFMESSMPGFLNWLTTVIEGIARAVPAINWKVTPEKFPLDGQWVNFIAIVCSLSSYIICSLVEWLVFHRPAFDMDRLLHRGKYLIKSDHISQDAKPLSGWRAALPNKEFTTGDKFLYYAKLIWTMLWFAVFVAFCAWQLGWSMPVAAWAKFWGIKVAITVVIGTGTTVWFFIGGIYDIRALFRTLGTLKRDHLDDGRVVNHHNVEDEVLIEAEDGSAGEPAGQPTGEPTDEDGAAGAGAAVEAGKKEESTGEETL